MRQKAEESRILIMDDSADNVYLLERLLHRKGFIHLRGLTDPRAFLAAVADFAPDLILLDLQMPYVDGLTLLEQLRGTTGGALPLVLVLTADITAEARDRARALGVQDFLYKPFDVMAAAARIRSLLEPAPQPCGRA